ncbi:hypothetical protein BC832DRAFT_323542 [Gaertneriomyces semiglobifer]|nr:hypothetical protein BC832DRAFT_323542 [Gaertneriomyces semiglobifer]
MASTLPETPALQSNGATLNEANDLEMLVVALAGHVGRELGPESYHLFMLEMQSILENDDVAHAQKVHRVWEVYAIFFEGYEMPDTTPRRVRERKKPKRKDKGKQRASPVPNLDPSTKGTSFLQTCPEEILLFIFLRLDPRSLCRSAKTCRYWNTLIKSFELSLWTNLSQSMWGYGRSPMVSSTVKEFFKVQWDVQLGRYHRRRLKSPDATSDSNHVSNGYDSVESPTNSNVKKEPCSSGISTKTSTAIASGSKTAKRRHYISAWPTDPANAYVVALDAETSKICWVLPPDVQRIYVQTIEDNGTLSEPQVLEGHEHAVGLILSNMEGTLVSFDDTSTIMIWDLVTMKFERAINANTELGFIFSMNIHKRRIVTGGNDGLVIVWDADTGDVIWKVQVEDLYRDRLSHRNLLNVAIWDDLVAYGVGYGGFWIGDLKKKKLIARITGEQMKKAMAKSRNCVRNKRYPSRSRPRSRMLPFPITFPNSLPNPDIFGMPSHPLSNWSSWDVLSTSTSEPQPSSSAAVEPVSGGSMPLNQDMDELKESTDAISSSDTEGSISSHDESFDFASEESSDDSEPVGPETHPSQLLNLPSLPMIGPPWEPVHGVQLFPMTLALNGHILLTNGPESSQLIVWDLRKRKALYSLDTTLCSCGMEACEHKEPHDDNSPDVKFAEVSKDGSMIFASVLRRRQQWVPVATFDHTEFGQGPQPNGHHPFDNPPGLPPVNLPIPISGASIPTPQSQLPPVVFPINLNPLAGFPPPIPDPFLATPPRLISEKSEFIVWDFSSRVRETETVGTDHHEESPLLSSFGQKDDDGDSKPKLVRRWEEIKIGPPSEEEFGPLARDVIDVWLCWDEVAE